MKPDYRILTPEGRGAIAVVRVWGQGAVDVVDSVFHPARGQPLAQTSPGRLRLGRAGFGLGDEVVGVRVASETPTVELQCHGGSAAIASVITTLEAAGARRWDDQDIEPGPTDDPIAAEAWSDLPHAPTLRTAEILLDQVHGALRQAIDCLLRELECGAVPMGGLDALIRRAAVGLRLLSGWKVVIAGRPNVGKSRLFNALAGFARAIVDPTPGVTRDVVTIRTAFGGWPIELADTAGLRSTDDPVESLGIARSRREQTGADLVLLVLDRSEPLRSEDRALIAATSGALVIANKSDLAPAWDACEALPVLLSGMTLSAERGAGIAELVAAIVRHVIPDSPGPGDAVPFRAAHLEVLRRARACVIAGDRAGAVQLLAAMNSGCPQ
jgi:tRNA modification GTPase